MTTMHEIVFDFCPYCQREVEVNIVAVSHENAHITTTHPDCPHAKLEKGEVVWEKEKV